MVQRRSRPRQAQEIESNLRERLPKWAKAGGRLPSEAELTAEFNVSRVTLREALASLERKGLITRKHGLGTFVNTNAVNIQTGLDESVEFGELIRAANYEPELGFLDIQLAPAASKIVERLEIEPDEPTLVIKKLFKASGEPVIYCTNIIPLSLIPASQREQVLEKLNPKLSIYSILARWFNQEVAVQISSVSACEANTEEAKMLEGKPGIALLRLEDVGYNTSQQPVFFSDAVYKPGMIQFQLVRRPVYTLEEISEGSQSEK